MRLGFIGTGKIASSVIEGICNSKIKYKKIIVSKRNNKVSLKLKKKFKKIIIYKSNQHIVDNSDWIFLSVTPFVGTKIINTYISERLDDQISVDLITPVKKSPAMFPDFEITVKKHRFSDFIYKIEPKKLVNYSLFL